VSRKLISARVLKVVVKDMGDVFTTKDVSEDPRVMNAHPRLVKHSHYHAFVGGALSDHRRELGIDEFQKRTPRGSRWEKKGSPFSFLQRKKEIGPNEADQIQDRKAVDHFQAPKFEKIVSLVCPSCGGNLKNEPGTKHYVCSHTRCVINQRSFSSSQM
jgi:hypothetical protein